MKTDIGIIGALSEEVEGLIARLKKHKTEHVGGIEFHLGTIEKKRVVIAKCGVGKVFAAICAQAMIVNYEPSLIVNSGVGGALGAGLRTGDVVIADRLCQHDMDTSPLGDPVGMISGINIVKIPADKTLVEKITAAAARIGIPSACGVIASGDQFIADKAKKAWIRDTFDAIACEMEGAAIGQVAYANGIGFAVIRAISDNADDAAGALDYPTLCTRAAAQTQKLIEALFLA